MKDPYETLEVSKDATPEVIKKAYRKAAKKKHPDSGGQTEDMAEIASAYMVLSNPEKRKRFDETGTVEPDNKQSKIYAEFCQLVEKILLEQPDLSARIKLNEFTMGSEGHWSGEKAKISRQKDLIWKAKARVLKHPENDVLGMMVEQKLIELDRQAKTWDEAIEVTRAAIKMFEEYQFKEPEETALGTMQATRVVFTIRNV